MRLISFFTFGILLISAFGCQQQVEDKYTEQLDSAIAVIEAAQLATNAISKDKLEHVKPVFEKYQEFFANEYDDYENLDFYRNELADLGQCNKSIEHTLENLQAWKKELATTLKQLTDLKHDYQNGLIEADELQTYLNNELFATFQINKNIQKNIGVASNCLGNFKALTDVLDSVRLAWIEENTDNE